MTEIEKASDKVEIPSLFMSDIMKILSELECEIWDNRVRRDRVKMQNMVIHLKYEIMSIDKNNRDIVTVDGLKYKRVLEE